MKGEMGPQPKG